MRKRTLALILALTLALALTGCGGAGDDAQAVEEQAGEQTEEPASGQTEAPETAEPAEEQPAWQPGGPVSVLVADQPGSLADITARVLAQYLEKYIGQLVNVEDIPGAYTEANELGEIVLQACEGTIGWLTLAGRAPDGLTLGYVELPTFSNALCQWPALVSEQSYTPICTHTTRTAIIVSREAETRFTTLEEMVAYGRALPAETPLVAASDSEKGRLHTWTQLFAKQADMPYSANHLGSATGMLQALRDGGADFAVVCADDILERDEGLRVMGVFGSKRLDQYPDAPTLGELGLYGDWLGCASCVMAPAGVPQDAVAFYARAFEQAMADERYLAASSGITTDYRNTDDTQSLMTQQLQLAQLAGGELWLEPVPAPEAGVLPEEGALPADGAAPQ